MSLSISHAHDINNADQPKTRRDTHPVSLDNLSFLCFSLIFIFLWHISFAFIFHALELTFSD